MANKKTTVLNQKQMEFVAYAATGEYTAKEIQHRVNISEPTYNKYKKNPRILEEIAAIQKANMAKIEVKPQFEKVITKREGVDREKYYKGLNDFVYFRNFFLDRKTFSCQKRWVNAFETEEKCVLLCPRRHGKSTTVLDYVVWQIVKNRKIRILILSKSPHVALRWNKKIKAILEHNKKLIMYYGIFKPEKPVKWDQNEFIVEGADIMEEHPTLSSYGLDTSIYGLRADLIICDDIVDQKNSMTEETREKLDDLFFSGIVRILDQVGGKQCRLTVIGTRKHPLDLYGKLKNTPGFKVLEEGAVLKWPSNSLPYGKILCPGLYKEQGGISFFIKERKEMGLKKFNREYMNAAFDDRDVIVPSDAFDNGNNKDERRSWGHFNPEWYIVVSADPGTSTKEKKTFCVTVEGFNQDDPNKRYLIEYYDDIVPSEDQPYFLCSVYQQFGASALRIETNACQKYLMDAVLRVARSSGVYKGRTWRPFIPNVHPHFTSFTKLNDPIAGLETVGHRFEQGDYSLPYQMEADEEKTDEFITKLCGYTYKERNKAHLCMTLWFAENDILDRQSKDMAIIPLETPSYRMVEPSWLHLQN